MFIGKNGVSHEKLASQRASTRFARIHPKPARMPAIGPTNPPTGSATTGNPRCANRLGSPFALMIRSATCTDARAIARSTSVVPPSGISALSTPPIRRPWPPARITPTASATMAHLLSHNIGRVARFFLSEQTHDLAVRTDVDRIRRRHLRKSGHRHDLAADGDDELGARREPHFANVERMIRGRTLRIRVGG